MTDLATQQQPDFFEHFRSLGRRHKVTGETTSHAPAAHADAEQLVAEALEESAAAPIAPAVVPDASTTQCEPSVTERILSRNASTCAETGNEAADEDLVSSLRRRTRASNQAVTEELDAGPAAEVDSADTTEISAHSAEPLELPALRVAEVETPLHGVEDIYHNLRALVRTASPARIVFAGASEGTAARSVVLGIAEHAAQRGQRVVMAELLDPTGRTLLVRLATPSSNAKSAPLLELDLHSNDARERIGQWLARELPDTDLLLIAGPALADTVDSALLASACDGLIIVAESGVTDRDALATAAERAQVTNAPTLGVVVDGTRDRLPAWLRRWIPGRRHALTPTYTETR